MVHRLGWKSEGTGASGKSQIQIIAGLEESLGRGAESRQWIGFSASTRIASGREFRTLLPKVVSKTMQAATGWLELGIVDEALVELESLPLDMRKQREALELRARRADGHPVLEFRLGHGTLAVP